LCTHPETLNQVQGDLKELDAVSERGRGLMEKKRQQ